MVTQLTPTMLVNIPIFLLAASLAAYGAVRWGSRLDVVGVVVAALSVSVSVVGVNSVGGLYWAEIVLAICGSAGAAILGTQYPGGRYAGGVVSSIVSVFVIGYGVERGNLLTMRLVLLYSSSGLSG